MVTGVHFLLTYVCTFECDHCFLYCGPHSEGTFTVNQLTRALDDCIRAGTINGVCFEGGEPFLFYPLLIEGVKMARERGFRVGIVTNAYWANSAADARLWLTPLRDLGLADLSLSDDALHKGEDGPNTAQIAARVAADMSIPVSTICIEKPEVIRPSSSAGTKGEPVVGGDVLFKGRAADKLTEGLPRVAWENFDECPHEDLKDPSRVHIDCFGNVHICQGISIGNMWEKPLGELVAEYEWRSHPICAPLVQGGPAQLVREYGIEHDDGYVDACHFCFDLRRKLVDRFPDQLCPRQVYGLTGDQET
jgi:hypothetical protein